MLLIILIRYCRIFHLFAIPTAPIRSGTPLSTCQQRSKPTDLGDLHHIPLLFFFLLTQAGDVIPTLLFFLLNEIGAFGLTKKTRDRIDNIYVTEKQTIYYECIKKLPQHAS